MFVDVQSNRKFLTQILKIKGLKVIDMAEDGAIAVEKVQAGFIQDPNKQPYDIIFMDNTMPEMVRSMSLKPFLVFNLPFVEWN